jgi:hypothetical protein
MSDGKPVLHLLCGKIASGKSTLAGQLAEELGTVLISEDRWLDGLYGDQMETLRDYVRFAGKLRAMMGPHVAGLLRAGISVVLDFPANTVETRACCIFLKSPMRFAWNGFTHAMLRGGTRLRQPRRSFARSLPISLPPARRKGSRSCDTRRRFDINAGGGVSLGFTICPRVDNVLSY